jgi:hypothetical protein
MSKTVIHRYALNTNAPIKVTAAGLGIAWRANILRARIPIEELSPYRYRLSLPSGSLIAALSEDDAGGTRLRTSAHETQVRQSTLLLLIPLGPKQVAINGLQRDLFRRKMPVFLDEKGYTVAVDLTPVTI